MLALNVIIHVHEKHERHEKEPGIVKHSQDSKAAVKDFPFVPFVYFVDKGF